MKSKKLLLPNIAKAAKNKAVIIIKPQMIHIWLVLIILVGASSAWPQTVTYTYDNLNRLEKIEYAGGALFDFTYDNVGNRLTKSLTFGLNDVIAILKLMTGYHDGAFSSVDINADGKIGMPELIYVMQRLTGLRD